MADIIFPLNNGHKMPGVGLGCWMGAPGGGEKVEKMVATALELGYRHLDTASGYANEEHVGKAIKESKIPRSEIFLTTKLGNGDHGRVKEAFEESLAKLDSEYVDLYLMHWPQSQDGNGNAIQPGVSPTYVETWQSMEALLDTGKVKAIGVSNFSQKTLEDLLSHAKIIPAVNQVQMHPCLPDRPLLEYCTSRGIHITAYSPLGRANSPFFSDETVKQVADKYGITIAQVLLSWGVQRGTSVIPKSENPERLTSNFQIVVLEDSDFKLIDELHKKPGMHRQLLISPIIDPVNGTVFGWTYDQMGWNLTNDGRWKE